MRLVLHLLVAAESGRWRALIDEILEKGEWRTLRAGVGEADRRRLEER